MKILFSIILISLSVNAFAQCGGAAGAYRVNPDTTPGGFVATSAFVSSEAFTEPTTSVCDTAKVFGEAHLLGSTIIKGSALVQSNPNPNHVIIQNSLLLTRT